VGGSLTNTRSTAIFDPRPNDEPTSPIPIVWAKFTLYTRYASLSPADVAGACGSRSHQFAGPIEFRLNPDSMANLSRCN
jgi:hypothetical protein